jgi:hypothetical protein
VGKALNEHATKQFRHIFRVAYYQACLLNPCCVVRAHNYLCADVPRLVRAKYQDNLENMQWFKSFFEKNFAGGEYDPLARRAKGKGAELFAVGAGGKADAEEKDHHPVKTSSRPTGSTATSGEGLTKPAPKVGNAAATGASTTGKSPIKPTGACNDFASSCVPSIFDTNPFNCRHADDLHSRG